MKKEYLNEIVNEYFNETLELRRHIHKHPELSYQEYNTADYIRKFLTKYDISFRIIGNTGTVATIGSGENCVALRADIDALPIYEETGLDFASQNDGVMHACGHDMHTSMLLSAARILKKNEPNLDGVVKLIFQPAEEKLPGGALLMIENGVLENPKPQAIFAQHIYPGAENGTISVASGPVLASTDELYWTIKGKSAHAAQPHLGSDAILVCSHLVNYYQSILTKFKNPLDSGVLSVTSIHGGVTTNIFPDEVKMMGTLRTYNDDWRFKIHDVLRENSQKIAELYNCSCELEIIQGYPAVINNQKLCDFVVSLSDEINPDGKTLEFEPKMWAEDFAYYARQIPACFWMLGVRPSDLDEMPPLHNSKLNPVEESMKTGIKMLVYSAYKFLNNQ